MSMARIVSSLLFTLCIVVSLLFSLASANSELETAGWLMPMMRSGCKGTIAECLSDIDEEFDLDSESNRRVLATRRRYISYGALRRNNVPCSRRGASYTRGCSAITRCRS
ncbi:rapid alkalinization factor [Olea europaea subsp. europaea]|uniref:Rapid alkalinization factor n=2 Tax=Olea europaea subsp. europaea TaxID=158383 RepID=A0A8S0SD08_OLEEU|nr:rapid alkalinization factor [Olea europaea subsp. europaea]